MLKPLDGLTLNMVGIFTPFFFMGVFFWLPLQFFVSGSRDLHHLG